jgi:hypothetical protein
VGQYSGWIALRQGMFIERGCHIALLKECLILRFRDLNMSLLRSEVSFTINQSINLKSEICNSNRFLVLFQILLNLYQELSFESFLP